MKVIGYVRESTTAQVVHGFTTWMTGFGKSANMFNCITEYQMSSLKSIKKRVLLERV